ncbi:unnamed protein product [Polarella glacialis]|uniref:Uncharacterized protein n=1 Tax=Polarella glacialis TaxID=89957 RepID=A0A813LTZ7_POLGL|nr:unnamed protein product [Polarella glacialis]CAE8621320.1 unnamed protein product [Polarella glacialis]CAE8739740.1 unnamed protein product [Polarella glacialis]
MSVNLHGLGPAGPMPGVGGFSSGSGGSPSGSGGLAASGGSARAIVDRASGVAQDLIAALPSSLSAVPGDPAIASKAGFVAGVSLMLASVLGASGILEMEASSISHLSNTYVFLIAALAAVVEVETAPWIPQSATIAREVILGQARFLGTSAGMTGLQLVLCSLALAQGSVGYILLGLPALVAAVLDALVWHARSMSAQSAGDGSGLIDGQLDPMARSEF